LQLCKKRCAKENPEGEQCLSQSWVNETIVSVLHTWMSCLDSGGSVRTVFVDFHKAFDLVNHNILYNKLKV